MCLYYQPNVFAAHSVRKSFTFFQRYHFENGKMTRAKVSLVLFAALTLLIRSLPLLLFHNGRILRAGTQPDCSLCLVHVADRNLASPAGHRQHVRRRSGRNIVAKPAWLSSGRVSGGGRCHIWTSSTLCCVALNVR